MKGQRGQLHDTACAQRRGTQRQRGRGDVFKGLHGAAGAVIRAASLLPVGITSGVGVGLRLRDTLPESGGGFSAEFHRLTSSDGSHLDARLPERGLRQVRDEGLTQSENDLGRAERCRIADGFRPGFPQGAILRQGQQLVVSLLHFLLGHLPAALLPQSIEGIFEKLLARHPIGHGASSHGCANAAGCCANKSTADGAAAGLDEAACERPGCHPGRDGACHAAHGEAQARACFAKGITRAGGLATHQPVLTLLLHPLLVGRIRVKRRACLR